MSRLRNFRLRNVPEPPSRYQCRNYGRTQWQLLQPLDCLLRHSIREETPISAQRLIWKSRVTQQQQHQQPTRWYLVRGGPQW
uniref:Uncharacterized protein n=1 Tax=Caenorhabditis japonica TaxID=281687 RepID=A0A8R1IGA9_CAEJA